ncbi:GNAT family N-acetyltransferase [Legionella longbeachae]|uniref:Putative acetyltransferase, GNAT family n=1 Tax=Legionella longbeachae serogroup 1 (strain NSW150) TaxID=661367 RepID=D3HJL5_LEGLN|nr:GNAT family N-acetyltransferase [Legionella longbeachae]VEE03143.1 GNAT family acetyltransferase [Legionella oakridgensis]HBD7398946.1 GNAT family N-acetyltransferase [Legionella pneumophila]ARB93957.1 GNAT family N-acetyltransferase [Legionella longbeachae]ARM32905.1 GNAT family N-acetyltransferase [Legionella longbeachae]EEZ94281.1 GNAT family acetyltransferase [Legionella longbeachae D-4968]
MHSNPAAIKPQLIPASLNDYPTIRNMARFYIYDLSRSCGHDSADWALPSDGLYEAFDCKKYFEEASRKAFLIKILDELAGFVLLNKVSTFSDIDWNVGEFFILARFQRQGIGQLVAHELWNTHPGRWEVSVLPENKGGLSFWRKTISVFTNGKYSEAVKEIDYDQHQPKRITLNFATQNHESHPLKQKVYQSITFVDKLSESLEKYMTKDLIAYERSHGVDVNYKRFSVVLTNEVNEVCGVINAFTAFAEIYIDDIWVDAKHRGKGYGRQLIDALETHFKGKGFNNINLCTSAFQAPEFYRKCGFQEEFTRTNKKNPQLSKTFFVKFFNEEQETQGCIN